MSFSLLLTTLPLLSLATASPTPAKTRPCIDLSIPLSINATNSHYDIPRVDNTIDAIDFVWDLDRWTAPTPAERVLSTYAVTETFTISARLCVPQNSNSNSAKRNILQIATHGFGFDKRYWDPEIHPDKYSYVDAALAAGYSILTYDRLGVGLSDKPDGYEIVQTPVEVEILKGLTVLARDGDLAKVKDVNSALDVDVPPFEKIVLVGHSLGSGLTLGILSSYPGLVNEAVSTGLIPSDIFGKTGQRAFGLEYAAQSDADRFGDRGSGYLTQGTVGALQQIFFKKGFFDEEMLHYAETIKETGTVGEFVSLAASLGESATSYRGPILFALGEFDFAVCLGNCTGAYDLDSLRENMFPAAADVRAHVQPGSGHALTMHSNATGHYRAIFDYLDEFGL